MFDVKGDFRINVNQPGVYEFTISGVLRNMTQGEQLSIILKNETINVYDIAITGNNACSDVFFSQTFILEFDTTQVLRLSLQKDDSYPSTTGEVSILIKKMPF